MNINHANELRRHADKVGRPSGDIPAVMHQAAAHIEDLERRLREAEARVAAPPVTAPVRLTDRQIYEMTEDDCFFSNVKEIARAVEDVVLRANGFRVEG